MEHWQKIGEVGVDAGLIWVGDPCYIHHDNSEIEKEWGKTWSEFCEILSEKEKGKYPTAVQFNYSLGHPGLGVCVSSGYGDGCYPVFVKRKDGMIKELKVVFF
jgi:hypothetical protein